MIFFMNLLIQDELQPFAEELKQYITPVFLEEPASDPLVRLCSRLHAAKGTLLSHEGLNKRLHIMVINIIDNKTTGCK